MTAWQALSHDSTHLPFRLAISRSCLRNPAITGVALIDWNYLSSVFILNETIKRLAQMESVNQSISLNLLGPPTAHINEGG